MNISPALAKRVGWVLRTTCSATLALLLSGFAFAQQEQPPAQEPPIQSQDQVPQQSQPQAQPPQTQDQTQPPQSSDQTQPPAQTSDRPPQSQQTQPQNQQPAPLPQQDSNRPPVSVDRIPQNAPQDGQENPPQPEDRYGQAHRPRTTAPSEPSGPPPSLLTIPKGTVVIMRLNEPLSSDHNQIGDQFTGTLEQPIVVNGWVVARRGQTVVGQVKSVKKAGRIKGTSQLGVELTDVTLVDGQQAPILTELWKASGGTTHGADAATIGGGTALGAIIGSAADWGTGAAIGAGAGAVAGIGAVLLTRGRPTILEPESQLSFRLVDPVKVDTTGSQQAFLPVTQQDFGTGRGNRPRLRSGRGYYGEYGPYAPCGYYYPCYYGPGYVGLYPSFGFGWGWGGGYYGRGWYGGRGYRRR